MDINGGFVDDETALLISENIATQKNTVRLRWWRRCPSHLPRFEFHHSALLVSAERNNAMRSKKTDNEQDVNMNDFGDSVSFEIVRMFFFFVTVCLLLVIHALVYRVFWDCVKQTPKLSAVRWALLRAPCRPQGCLCSSRASLALPRLCVLLTLDVVHQFRPALGGCPSVLLRC